MQLYNNEGFDTARSLALQSRFVLVVVAPSPVTKLASVVLPRSFAEACSPQPGNGWMDKGACGCDAEPGRCSGGTKRNALVLGETGLVMGIGPLCAADSKLASTIRPTASEAKSAVPSDNRSKPSEPETTTGEPSTDAPIVAAGAALTSQFALLPGTQASGSNIRPGADG